MAPAITRPLRADAERNRRKLLDAAADLFARKGLSVGLDEIARHAGVGAGTAYRRFPDKEQLIDALFEDRVEQVVALAEQAAERDAVVRIVARAQAAGQLRGDVEHTDIALTVFMLTGLADITRGTNPDVWRRHLRIVLDGLRTPQPGAMPAAPLSPDGLEQVIEALPHGTRR